MVACPVNVLVALVASFIDCAFASGLRGSPCVKVGDNIQDGQTCCDGAMPYHANGGSYCKAIEPACVKAPQQIHDGQTCCEGAVRVPDDPYHPSEGYYCKAIVLGSAPCVTAPDQVNLKFQSCCDGAMPYHANGGTYCHAMCVHAGDVIQDGQTCCDGAMPYHANGGSYCKAIGGRLLSESESCQAESDPCTPSVACCGGLTCQKTQGGGWDMQCVAPPCVKAGDVIADGQTCCHGAMPYHANGGSYCHAMCVQAGDVIQDGQTCCDGAMPYHASGGSYCKAIGGRLLGASSGTCQAEYDPCTPSTACCNGMTCSKTQGGGWDMQCTACVKAGDLLPEDRVCCEGSAPVHANFGSYCQGW